MGHPYNDPTDLATWRITVILKLSTGLSIQRPVNQNETRCVKSWLENESKPIIIFLFLSIPSLISKDQKGNIICTKDDVRGDYLGPPHSTSPVVC